MFFAKPLAEKNVINDLDKNLVNFYKDLKKNGCQIAKKCKLPTTKKEFEKLNENKSCGFYGKVRTSYGAQRQNFVKKDYKTTNFKKQCESQQSRLKNTEILNDDFEKVIKKHNKKDTFAYLDPPYVQSEKVYKTRSDVNPERICKSLNGFKGKFILSYNDHPKVRKACKNFKIKAVGTNYEMQKSSTKKSKKVKELLIKNY